ncbi:hypothetical protein WG78_14775 [Amantichitinum ursilacus]|uniref:Lipoprotein n=2 Tax=Amantichitinum ursilacus TaxID=857265 RepID=A0A0N0GMS2_9NEIS|nr:hypothetical protein WG78_14775 [Amantichitinum ursilacus]
MSRCVLISLTMALAALGMTGCDQVNTLLNKQQANGKAIGAACRESGRGLEDCYKRNGRVAKADIFGGWREMNEYMISKKMEIVPPPPDNCGPGNAHDDATETPKSDASAASAAAKAHDG